MSLIIATPTMYRGAEVGVVFVEAHYLHINMSRYLLVVTVILYDILG